MAFSPTQFRGNNRDEPRYPFMGPESVVSTSLNADERARAQPIIEAKVDALVANLTPKQRQKIVSAALQNPQLAQQMRTGGIGFTSDIVQSAVQAAIGDAQVASATKANVTDPNAAATATDADQGLFGNRHHVAPAFAAMNREMRERGERGSSKSYGEIFTGSNWSSEAGMAHMRSYAQEMGVGWAANNPELLRLGPSAIKALADVHLSQDSYKRLRTDGHFEAKDTVTLAEYAKKKGIDDANPLANATAGVVQLGRTRAEQNEIKNTITGYMAKPDDLEGKRRHDEMLERVSKHPGGTEAVNSYREKARIEKHTALEAKKATVIDQAKEVKQNDALGAFDALPAAAASTAAKPEVTAKAGEKPKANTTPPAPAKAPAPK